jgi:hypothetical protein
MGDSTFEFVVTLEIQKPITTISEQDYAFELLQEYVNKCYCGYFIREIIKSSIKKSLMFIDIHNVITMDVAFNAHCIKYSLGDIAFGEVNKDTLGINKISTLSVFTPLSYKAIITLDRVYTPGMGIPVCIVSEPNHKPMTTIIEAVGTGFAMSQHFNKIYEFDGSETFAISTSLEDISKHTNYTKLIDLLFHDVDYSNTVEVLTQPGYYSLIPGVRPKFKRLDIMANSIRAKFVTNIVTKKYFDMCEVIAYMLSYYKTFDSPECKACIALIKS